MLLPIVGCPQDICDAYKNRCGRHPDFFDRILGSLSQLQRFPGEAEVGERLLRGQRAKLAPSRAPTEPRSLPPGLRSEASPSTHQPASPTCLLSRGCGVGRKGGPEGGEVGWESPTPYKGEGRDGQGERDVRLRRLTLRSGRGGETDRSVCAETRQVRAFWRGKILSLSSLSPSLFPLHFLFFRLLHLASFP